MLVFCEDCGAKHNVDEEDVIDAHFQLRCDGCDFLITAKSLPKPKIASKPVDPTMELTSSHDCLEFGVVSTDHENAKTLILAAKDGRKVELTGKLDAKLNGNVSISAISGMVFRVEVMTPAQISGSCLTEYNGPGVMITDTISHFHKVVNVSFSRD